MFGEIPQFALGRWYWDQWLVYRARRLGGALIDASACVMAIHQNHDYRHIVDLESKGGKPGAVSSPSATASCVKSILMTLEDADWQVDGSGLSASSQDPLAPFEWGRAEGRDPRIPALIRKPLVWIARQQWDRVEERCGADLGAA